MDGPATVDALKFLMPSVAGQGRGQQPLLGQEGRVVQVHALDVPQQ